MGMAPLRQRERLLKTAQRSTRITKKSKSVPEAIRSIRIKENAEKKNSLVFNKIKNGDPLQFQKLSRREVSIMEYTPSTLLKTKESLQEMVGAVSPGSRTINEVADNTRVI